MDSIVRTWRPFVRPKVIHLHDLISDRQSKMCVSDTLCPWSRHQQNFSLKFQIKLLLDTFSFILSWWILGYKSLYAQYLTCRRSMLPQIHFISLQYAVSGNFKTILDLFLAFEKNIYTISKGQCLNWCTSLRGVSHLLKKLSDSQTITQREARPAPLQDLDVQNITGRLCHWGKRGHAYKLGSMTIQADILGHT